MVPISHPVRRSVVTNIAGSVDATLTGNGGTPIAAADVVGGLTTKTIAFAAGETLKYATWDLVDDSAVEGTEGYKVTLSNPQPSGTLSVPSITGTVLDNDTSSGGGSGAFYDQTTADSGYRDIGANGGTIEFQLNDTDFKIYVRSDTDGKPGIYIGRPTNARFAGYYNSATKDNELIGGDWNYQDAKVAFNNTPAKIVMTATDFSLFIGDMTTPIKTDTIERFDAVTGGTFTNVRVLTNGAAVPIKITKA